MGGVNEIYGLRFDCNGMAGSGTEAGVGFYCKAFRFKALTVKMHGMILDWSSYGRTP